ncbi:MAG: FAD-binding oxidoreductase [Bacteroidetes bacterium]|nr:FAD-binding oxidoreductase [Bacteroidota bacterium]
MSDSLVPQLEQHFPAARLKTRLIDRHAYSSDASFYTLVPRAIVFPETVDEIKLLFRLAAGLGTTLTFRTGGTSLSGQSVTDGILVDVSKHWPLVRVEDGGARVRVQPGVTGAVVNHVLRGYGRKIGPDPASINAAMIGGILSNNSSGMCCGVVDNSYHTLLHVRFVLADGSVFDTEIPADYARFEQSRPDLFAGITALRRKVMEDALLVARIKEKYKIKNTVGYGINAFVDYEHPLDILAHLLIGAEGTLGFIAEAVLRTVADKPLKSAALLFFDSPRSACDAVPALRDTGAEALEFMDRAALRSIEHLAIAPPFLRELPEGASCLLCEYQAESWEALEEKLVLAQHCVRELPLVREAVFTSDEKVRGDYWKLRKGMYPSVAAVRDKGTSVMLEDVAVPLDRLGEAIEALQELFQRFSYRNAIVFGHAKDGNLHFVVSQAVGTPEEIRFFGEFNAALAELVIARFGGALKAEHGTGRQIAPYVEAEWGPAAYAVMKELKALVDPGNIVNPGVILSAGKDSHLQHLKSLPVVEEEVDKCVECGYCEGSCPSRNFTLTPRQRIVLRRSLARLKAAGESSTYDEILGDYKFDGMDTCAVDGMCATNCPVDINTGELIKRLRRENHSPAANRTALRVAKSFAVVERLVKAGLRVGNVFGPAAMHRLTGAVRRVAPDFPLWTRELTGPVSVPATAGDGAVYFPTCITRMMGKDVSARDTIVDVFLRVARRAGVELFIPPSMTGVCCGQAFSSKGFADAYKWKVNETIEKVWEWTREGAIPVVLDISSCSHSLHTSRPYLTVENQARFDKLRILDSLEFAVDVLAPKLKIQKKTGKAVFHPVCSLHKMGTYNKLEQLGALTVEEPVIPFSAGCCGMAGDRGFYYPGLTAAAGKAEGAEAAAENGCGYYSTGKTCEMALSAVSGKEYRSILYLLDEVSAD